MRLVDVLLAFPFLIFAVGLAAILGPSLRNVDPRARRLARSPRSSGSPAARCWRSAEQDYVSAAVADGAGDARDPVPLHPAERRPAR